jgi:hypothetical protein
MVVVQLHLGSCPLDWGVSYHTVFKVGDGIVFELDLFIAIKHFELIDQLLSDLPVLFYLL